MPTFGRYEALFKIAAGGMAEVYAARIRGEAGFEKLVAVKRMLPHLADDKEFSAMFLDEARLAASIASPNVVSTLDLGRAEDGALYIVMELVVGVALSSLLKASAKRGRLLPVPIACEIIAQAASGLDDAHEARTATGVHLGIVHRDVSPQNVLVGGDGRVRVVDFGVARALLRQTHTSTGTLKGKFAYFSPEQASAKEMDRRSDVFALGIVAWETLVMQRLFDGENPLDQIQRVRELPIPIPSTLRPDIPRAVSDVVMQALERNPKKRLPTAAAFAAALRQAVGVVPPKEIAKYVADVSAEQMREIQLRIESALAGEHIETHVLRPSDSGSGREVVIQATPSSAPRRVAELATVIHAKAPSHAPGVTGFTPTPMLRRDRGAPDRRVWAYGLAISVVLIALVGAAFIARQPDAEPIATPLQSTLVVAPAPPPSPTPIATPIALPAPEAHAVPEPEPAHARPHVEHASADPIATPSTETIPAPSSEGIEPPRDHDDPPHTHASTPRETPTRPRETAPVDSPRRAGGLVGDDAFDRGI